MVEICIDRPNGALATAALGNGRLTARRYRNGAGVSLWSVGYGYDAIASYDASGTATTLPATTTQLAFPGQQITLADLYYNQYRDYDPTTGRYIQADPIGLAGGVNPYVYAAANPVMLSDPTGEAVPIIIGGIILGAGTDYAFQRLLLGRSHSCVDWNSVILSGSLGGLGAGVGRLGMYADEALEFSHWVPARYWRPTSLSGRSLNPTYRPYLDNRVGRWFQNSVFNGNYVSPTFHSRTDPFRYVRGFTKADNYHPVIQQLLRIPTVYAFPASSAGIGANLGSHEEVTYDRP